MSSPRPDLVGSTLAGKYRVKRRIGAGGMGAVYEGEHLEIGKRVAIKVIEHEHAQSEALALRFKREARAASAVESEHIVQVFDVGHDPVAGLYMVMEFLVGEDLSSYLEQSGGKLPVLEAASLVAQAARGLAKAHAAGVVHRDLKPANLFLVKREDGSTCVKVVDFGISKLSQRPSEQSESFDGSPSPPTPKAQTLTREGTVVGTPIYMSPEQAQGLKVDARTDVWSLGALLYEVVSGRPPYDLCDTYEQMIIQIVTKPVPSLAQTAPWVSPAVRSVVEAALTHDLARRTPDATTFARSLIDAARVPTPPPSSQSNISTQGRGGSSDPALELVLGATVAGPPTGTGVVVHAATGHNGANGAQNRKRVALLVIGAVGVLAIVGILIGVSMSSSSKNKEPPPPVAAGLAPPSPSPSQLATPPEPSAIPPPVAIVEPTPPPPAASSAPPPKPRVGAAAQTRGGGQQPATSAPPRSGQYGAAGVSTAY